MFCGRLLYRTTAAMPPTCKPPFLHTAPALLVTIFTAAARYSSPFYLSASRCTSRTSAAFNRLQSPFTRVTLYRYLSRIFRDANFRVLSYVLCYIGLLFAFLRALLLYNPTHNTTPNVYALGAKSYAMISAKSYPLLSYCFRMSMTKHCISQCLRQSYGKKMNIQPSKKLINVKKSLKRKDFSKKINLHQNYKLCTKEGKMCNFCEFRSTITKFTLFKLNKYKKRKNTCKIKIPFLRRFFWPAGI